MQLVAYLLPCVIVGLIDWFIISNHKKYGRLFLNIMWYFLFLNIIVLELVKLFGGMFNLQIKGVLNSSLYTLGFSIKYIIISLFIGIVFLLLKGLSYRKIEFIKDDGKSSKLMIFIKILSVVFVVIGAIFVCFSNWFVSFFGNITPEQFLFNLKSPLKGTAGGMVDEIIDSPLLSIFLILIISSIFIFFAKSVYVVSSDGNRKKILSSKIYSIAIIALSFVCMIGGIAYGANKLQLGAVAKMYFDTSNYIKDNYVDPRNAKLSFPAKKRNLIHIYLESMENSYLAKKEGGNCDSNLIGELATESLKGFSFSHNDKFGGPNQTYGSSWSVASMVNMDCGIPLKTPMGANGYGLNGSFLPGIINIGDILEAEGYEQTVMFGADADFGGLTTYFKTHGNYKIMDIKYAREHGLVPKDYDVWWGFEDAKLFKFAKDEITRMSNTGKPFNFVMETANTHFPDGYLPAGAPTPHDSHYANAITFSDKQAAEFIRWIQKQPFYENTTIVVTGDHLSMDPNFFKGWDPKYRRSIFNFILNPATDISKTNCKNREYSPLDFFPTMLSSIGVEIKGDRLGLGTNLFSGKKTLIERDGLKKFNDELAVNSSFYNDHFIDVRKTSVFNTKNVTIRPGGTTPVLPKRKPTEQDFWRFKK